VHPGGYVFALPGNPVAVFATLVAVYAAGLRRRLGLPTPSPAREYAQLAQEVVRRGNRPLLLPVRLRTPGEPGAPLADPLPLHGSGDFVSLARSGALAVLPDVRDRFAAGEHVEILRHPPGRGA
jgi:molybdopterin biosynthesis enzyme